MSLQVWLPLNGDLHNQGLSNITVTNNGATLNNSGKIGKCYSFSGSNSISINTVILPSQIPQWSFSCWFNLNDITTTTAECLFSERGGGGNANGYTIFLYPSSGQILVDDGVRWSTTPMTYTANTWYHLVVTRNTSGKKLYINGQLKSQTTTVGNTTAINNNGCLIGLAQSGSFLTSGNQGWKGKLSDVRIYDHALSAKEVEEIAKGLVLHYKLDNNGMGNPNLAKNSNTDSTSSNVWTLSMATGGSTKTIITDNGVHCVQIIRNDTAQSGWRFMGYNNFDRTAIKTDTYYTASFDIKSNYAGTVTFTGLVNSNATNYMTGSDRIVNCNTVYANRWSHISLTIKTISSFDNITVGNQIIYFAPSDGIYTTGNVILLKNIKLEEGKIDTYWIPNKSDALYSLYAANDTIIYDSSGYSNNGIIVGSLTVSARSPRYSCAMKFDGNTSCIKIPYNEINPDRIFTVNLWFHKDALGSKNYETLFGGPSGFEMDTRAGASTTLSLYMASVRGGNAFSPFNLNEWYMVTMVRNGTNEMYYINGELKKTIEAKSMPSGQYRIGAQASDTGQNYYGDISDFRIYATALTPEQIKELYNTSMSIDDKGNIHARELVEL